LAHHHAVNKETKDRIHYFAFCESSPEWKENNSCHENIAHSSFKSWNREEQPEMGGWVGC
jgi:hypothetical protein